MRDSPGYFLPRRRFLRAEHFRQIVKNQYVTSVRAARPQRTHGDSKVHHTPGSHGLNFPRNHSQPEGPAHKIIHNTRTVCSEKAFEALKVRITAGHSKHS